ncbi:hypothetical protein [Aminipila sp.]|uniref:hypothetical protein n=1 Tax=Aminipila sp. TaxID=2060095 RepID=UPI002898EEFD|nr:hypothetical protein [Aminipila sp.]
MNINQLISKNIFTLANDGGNGNFSIAKPFCCDLLSIAMGKAPAGCVWVTVMGNSNTLAVASLAEAACIIFAEGITLDDAALNKAKEHNITVMYTELPIFDAALKVHQLIQEYVI